MPVLICRNCGHKTNTALSDWVGSKDDKSNFCYARIVDDKWEKGCGFDKGDHFIKRHVENLVGVVTSEKIVRELRPTQI